MKMSLNPDFSKQAQKVFFFFFFFFFKIKNPNHTVLILQNNRVN